MPLAETATGRLILKRVIDYATGCWVWTGGKNSEGYGRIKFNGKLLLTHRLSYQDSVGPIPEGQYVLHRCDNRSCFNPDHLYIGTQIDNMQDRRRKGRYRPYFGIEQSQAKLTDEQVRMIRADQRTYREIAQAYGIHFSNVGRVKRRENWAHVR